MRIEEQNAVYIGEEQNAVYICKFDAPLPKRFDRISGCPKLISQWKNFWSFGKYY